MKHATGNYPHCDMCQNDVISCFSTTFGGPLTMTIPVRNMRAAARAIAALLLIGKQELAHGYVSARANHRRSQKPYEWASSRRLVEPVSRVWITQDPRNPTARYAENDNKGGTARFVGLGDDATGGLDYLLSIISSDIGSTVLGLFGLLICLTHRLANTDSLSADTLGQETRADLLAVFASGAVLLNGISKLDVTSALAESVVLDGESLAKPLYMSSVMKQQDDVTWALESILAATPAETAVLLTTSGDDGGAWATQAMSGVVPRDVASRQTVPASTPILDRFRNDSSKESYLPTLQALPGRVEFTYLPSNTQGALLLPVASRPTTVLVLGTDTAKSFSPRDVAWCQLIASRIAKFL